jgi:hypothetical protein
LTGVAATNWLTTNPGLRELFVSSLADGQIGAATDWNHGISVCWPARLLCANSARLWARALAEAYETVAGYFRQSIHSVRTRSRIYSLPVADFQAVTSHSWGSIA